MKSPVEPHPRMEKIQLEEGLNAFLCPASQGLWIPADSYWRWQENLEPLPRSERRPLPTPMLDEYSGDEDEEDSPRRTRPALLCPESGALLVRYRAGTGLNIHIEHSPITGGVWLDHGEWDILKAAGLHHELHIIFSSAYQHKISRTETRARMEELFENRLGEEDARKVRMFAEFLENHEHKPEIIAYLMNT